MTGSGPPAELEPRQRVVRLTVAYDGAKFAGYQLQPGRRTVQGEIERALRALSGRALRPSAAGRTDAGVHAEGQVLSVRLPAEVRLPLSAFVFGLNKDLPADVAVLAAAEAAPTFDARRSARGKLYRYRILNQRVRHPLTRASHWLIFAPLNLPQMQAAAAHFVGQHDFAAFRAADCQALTTVRRLDRCQVEAGVRPGELWIEFSGTAFLKHMVRNLVGTLVDVGRGRRSAASIPELIRGRDRQRCGRTAPAHGLTLVEVRYASG